MNGFTSELAYAYGWGIVIGAAAGGVLALLLCVYAWRG